jgi:tetratricopeptide (TPR) repeat protein/transcriptional regulator with XRE-family HTH domain
MPSGYQERETALMLQQPTSYRDTVVPPIPVHLGAFLKMLRDRYGIAQSEVLEHLPGWQQSAYSKVEKDTRSPVFEQLLPIYRALAQAGVQMTMQDRQQFVYLARRKIESMKTRHERKSDADWEGLRLALASIDRLPETTAPRPLVPASRSTLLPKRETGHLVGREAWLDALTGAIKGEPLMKVIIVQGPPGSGKTSELYRIAERFLQCTPRYHVVLCEPPPIDQEVIGPDIALELLLEDILDVVGSPLASLPPSGLHARVKYVLECLAKADRPVLLLFDHAEQSLNEQGDLAPAWKQFLSRFVHTRLDASMVLASREWPAWITLETQRVLHAIIPPLSKPEGRQVLQRLGLQEVPERQLDTVVEAVSGIPLCLEWVARLVLEPLLQDGWAALEEENEIVSSEQASIQSLAHLLEDASLFGGPVAVRVTSLLERVIKHLSPEASLALQDLAISPIPLASPALKALYHDPSPLKELRDASLLVAYPKRVQLLPMVAAQVRQLLVQEEVSAAEDRLIQALTVWLGGIATPDEQGIVVTEIALLLLKHCRFLDAAELLIEFGWLSSGYGNGSRLSRRAFEVMRDFDWRAEPETECGGILLRYYLGRFRGEKTPLRERAEEYQQILARTAAQQVPLKLATVAHLVQHFANYLITKGQFSQAHELLDSYLARIDFEQGTDQVDMLAPLLKTRAHALNARGEWEEEQGNRDAATHLREEALRVDLQCVELLRRCEGIVSHIKQSTVRYHLARTLNEIGYFLVNLKRGEEAMKALGESIDLKRLGYAQAGSMAMTVGEMGQALELVGQFQEALRCNEQALEETQQLAASGHATAQGDVYVHLIDRARLLLRIGNLQEAERLVNDALPHIRDSRGVYRDRAQEVLKEIADCRAAARDLGREYLDWRWYARYKKAIAFDVFGWLTHAGPFSPGEQEEWDRLCDRHDEQAQTRREQIIKASRDRELENALDEQREPHLLYPALRIEEVRAHVMVLQKLAAEISEQEPNAIVRRLYLEAIEEQVDYLLMVQATYQGNSLAFWEHNRRVHAEPTPEEMETTLGLFLDLLQRGVRQENTAEISASLLQDLQRVCYPDVLSHLQQSRVQEGRDEPPAPASGRVGDQRLISPTIAKQFFEAVLREYGFSGWSIQLDHATNNFRIEANVQTLFLPAYKPLSLARVRELLGHELEFHVLRAEAGKASPLALLAEGTRNFLTIDEGMAVYYDQQTARTQNQVLDEASVMTWIGTLATGLAAGVLSTPQTFLHLQRLLERLYLLDRLLSKREGDLGKATATARRLALNRCLRTYRGVPDLTFAGICYAKDAVYLRGFLQLQQAVNEDLGVLDRLMVGKIAYRHLPDMEEFGITIPSIRPRWYAQRPDLDEHILSFDASHAGQDMQNP